ncbi:hypothetical protein [Roseateles depolymerans]|nr:hypothetical protein [Roseateles depolymerans]
MNTYAYVENNPVASIDGWGLVKIPGIPGVDGRNVGTCKPRARRY